MRDGKPVITGIIAEYNPYHTGHLHHMEEAIRLSEADFTIVIMSGHYVQRGEPAIYNPYVRTRMALMAGADAVFCMPAPFSTASAEDFASYGISLLGSMGADHVSFGVEDATVAELRDIASVLVKESDTYKASIKEAVSSGFSFPVARAAAITDELTMAGRSQDEVERISGILSTPNNILGIEYMKALLKFRSPLKPVLVKRTSNNYNDVELGESHSSATSIRNHILNGLPMDELVSSIPEDCLELCATNHPISPDMYCTTLIRKIYDVLHRGQELSAYSDVSEDMADRIKRQIDIYDSWEAMVQNIKSKQYTYTRISRALMHILLGITSDDMDMYKEGRLAPYARLLGFRRESSDLLTELKKRSSVPIITKMADAGEILSGDDHAFKLIMDEVYAQDIYGSIYYDRYKVKLPNAYTQQIVII